MEIDHITVPVTNYAASKRYYESALRPLGFVVRLDWPDKKKVFFGQEDRPSCLWLTESDAAGSLVVSLAARGPEAVEAFHRAAVSAGGRTKDQPGICPERNGDYYAARVLDPDGNSLEAVFRGAVEARRRLAA